MHDAAYEIEVYSADDGMEPFTNWLHSLKDQRAQRTVLLRIQRIRLGNFDDYKSLRGAHGICELRIDYGPGLRVYFAKVEKKLIILLGGGNKASQEKDINRCVTYWCRYKEEIGNEKKP